MNLYRIWLSRGWNVQSEAPENRARENREGLLVLPLILTFLACAWLVYTFENRSWIPALDQSISWILNPQINYTPVQIAGVPWAFLATIEVLILGFASSYLLLHNEKDTSIKLLSIIGLGFGFTGFITIILGILQNLFPLPLNAAILLVSLTFLLIIFLRKKLREKLTLKEIFTPHFSLKITRPPNLKFWLPICVAIGVIFFLCFYHALLTVIMHWDAIVYHAAMANIMYKENAIPVIAGPSIGLQMSANFPPLFSALGAYYYIQIGTIEDFFLRAIPPVMGLLTVLATYKLGEVIAGKKFGLISALILSLTPLFFRYSIYATSYSILTFFCTVSILFLLLAITRGDSKYWISSGVFYGFALLTSYITLYLAPFLLIALLAYLLHKKRSLQINTNTILLKRILLILIPALIIGGVWYLRNLIAVGNPIYPNAYTVLGGINIDPLIMETTINGIKQSAVNSYFGEPVPLFDQIMIFLTFRTSFPAISFFTILGLVVLPTIKNKKLWLIAIWPLSLGLLIMSGVTWGFPHHMVFAMPGFAFISALPILKVLEMTKRYEISYPKDTLRQIYHRLPSIRKSTVIRVGLVAILFASFIFPSLTLCMGGKLYEENLNDRVPEDYLWLLKNPNGDLWLSLNQWYNETISWQWLNENLAEGQKVATIDNRIYYIKNCSNEYFFYLDGWEARELYNITDPNEMVAFLRNQNVTCVLDVDWARLHGHFDILPMDKYLGSPSPYFPTVLNPELNSRIFNVGPLKSPLTDNSLTPVSISKDGWSEVKSISGVDAQSIVAGNNTARLYVATPNLTSLKITYLDVGKDPVSINLHDPYTHAWINGYAVIQRNNTGQWKEYELMAPLVEQGFFEFGFHAYKEDFTIRKIYAAPYQSQGRALMNSFNGSLNMELMYTTDPPSLMVYVPMWNDSKQIEVSANSHGKEVCIEIFEGIIHPSETSNWWARHDLVIRAPNSITKGELDPSLVWETERSGLYTVVVVVRSEHKDAKVGLKISIGDTK